LDTIQQSARHLYSFSQSLKDAAVRSIVQRIADRAAAVITISEYSKRDIIRHYRLKPEKIHVTHLAADTRFFGTTSKRAQGGLRSSLSLPKEFLLYVGGIDPRKNVGTLMSSLALLYKEYPTSPPLAFAGRISNQVEYPGLMEEVRKLGLRNRVLFLGFVPDDQLPALFAAAKLFVFPSLLEGFGLPVVQAMASGIPLSNLTRGTATANSTWICSGPVASIAGGASSSDNAIEIPVFMAVPTGYDLGPSADASTGSFSFVLQFGTHGLDDHQLVNPIP